MEEDEEIFLTDPRIKNDDGVVKLFYTRSLRWPVRLEAANGNGTDLTDQEAKALLIALVKRYPLDALAGL